MTYINSVISPQKIRPSIFKAQPIPRVEEGAPINALLVKITRRLASLKQLYQLADWEDIPNGKALEKEFKALQKQQAHFEMLF